MAKKRKDGYLKKTFTIEGKRYYVYGKNSKELFQKEKAKREEIEAGFAKHDNPTVSEYFERWAEGRKGTVSESTLRTQDKIFNTVSGIVIETLSCRFGDVKIKKVTIDDLRKVQSALLIGRKTGSVNDYMALVKHIFSDACKERVIDYNPCLLLNPLKRKEEEARDTNHRALTLEEQTAFFESERCKNSYYYNVFRFAVSTGMRVGEIAALRYSDIHDDMICVERTLTRTETGSYAVGESAKTEAGRRRIPMNDQIRTILADQKAINVALDGNVLSMNDLLFKAPERGLLMATPADREIKRICKAVGIEPFTMHAFRGTFATRCVEQGMSPKTLQEILGHSNFGITMNLYAHCLSDTKKAAMDSIVIAI